MSKIEKWLLTVLFMELFIGGGGRQIEFGPISIRQVLFILLLAVYGYRVLTKADTRAELKELFSVKNMMSVITIGLLMWIAFSTLLGLASGHSISETIKDALRVSYVILIFPFWTYIRQDRFSLNNVLTLLKIATIIVATGTIIIGLCGKFFFVNEFGAFYEFINNLLPADLFFRPSRGVFYKSHFIVLFGLIVASNNIIISKGAKSDIVVLVLASISIIFSETRGLYIGYLIALLVILAAHILIYLIGRKDRVNKIKFNKKMITAIVFYLCAFTIVPTLYTSSTQARFNDGTEQAYTKSKKQKKNVKKVNDVSINMRVYLLDESVKILEKGPKTIIFGNGYGSQIGTRTDGIEMTFLDIWVEQGLIGVLIWLSFSMLPLFYYFKFILKHRYLDSMSIAMAACVLCMVVITNINPYLNSPIGLGFLLPVIVSAKRLEIERVASYQNNCN
ncbi:O-antigen ligase family protein [Vagococcus sp. BWB3-3]|uniref:O-antigen ligase family protein n=1 Tax=Vagococcus allomyrinae TaxID=2794353 RepID=A0A940PCQ9_9ENTE|nr:O-antigen ligase family protein [Vagococcus allomyrinae]MBP1043681.1 O-antigen ligase family protein [Vagococcus allomyrinae]